MPARFLALLGVLAVTLNSGAFAQAGKRSQQPLSAHGRTVKQLLADLKAPAAETRNAAAYELAGMGPAAQAAVPALIEALEDESQYVRFPVAVALGEIGPGAKAAVPALTKVMEEDFNDDVAAAARRALRRIQPASKE